jgi:selenocysteine lyase/cysteine desulfurase
MGQLPGLLRPEPGSTILAVATDFPAVTRPWLRYAAEHDCTVHFVEDDPAVDLTDALADAVGSETGAVAVSFVQYGTGTRIDVPRLRKRTAPLGVPLIVDATQAAGLLRVDAVEWGADAVVTSG